MADVCIFGSINFEVILGAFERAPVFGEQISLPTIEYRKGGSLLSVVFPLARLGIISTPIGIIGDDEIGYWLRNGLREYGLPVNAVEVVPEYTTPCTISFYNTTRNYMHASYHGSSHTIDSELLISKYGRLINESRFFMFTGLFTIPGFDLEKSREVLQYVYNNRKKVLLNLELNPHGWKSFSRDSILELLQFVSIFLLDRTEGEFLTGSRDPAEIARILNNYGPQKIIVRCGDEDTIVYSESGVEQVPVFPVQALNSIGADDAFNAGIIYGLLHEWHIRRTLIFANALAAIYISHEYPDYPTRIEVERFIDSFEE